MHGAKKHKKVQLCYAGVEIIIIKI